MKQFEKTGEVDTSEVAAKLKNLKQKREDEKSEGEGGSASTEQFWDVCEATQNEFVEFPRFELRSLAKKIASFFWERWKFEGI